MNVGFAENDSLVAKAEKIQAKLSIPEDGWLGGGSQGALDNVVV